MGIGRSRRSPGKYKRNEEEELVLVGGGEREEMN